MIAETLLFINVLTGVSLSISIFLHMIFNSSIPYRRRLALIFPGFSMVCYTLTAVEWWYNFQSASLDIRQSLLYVVVWMVMMSIGIMTHYGWGQDDAERH